MSKSGIILVWTSVLTVVLLIWLQINPLYEGEKIPDRLRSFVVLDVRFLDFEELRILTGER